MTDKLPGNLLALFTPRPPPRHLPHVDYDPAVRHTTPITGIAAYLQRAEEVKEKYQEEDEKNPPTQSWLQLKDQQKANHLTHKEDLAALAKTEFHPKDDPNLTTDPLKTIIVARLARDADKKDLEREFGRYGPIDKIKLIQNPDAKDEKKKSRCYAFVTFEKAGDAKSAIRDCEGGITIRGRRSIVDVERGRTVPNWLPRRYGGGLGGRHYTKVPKPSGFGGGMYGGAPSGPGGFRGGFRDGGRRGGFGGGGGDRFGGGGGGRFGGGDRRDGGGFRGNGFGGPPNGAPNGPNGAPSGPRGGGRSGGYGGGGGSYGGVGGGGSYGGGSAGGFGGGDRYDDRARGSGSNREPLSRGPGTRYHDRDGAGDDYSRKRGPPEGETEDPRQRRRY